MESPVGKTAIAAVDGTVLLVADPYRVTTARRIHKEEQPYPEDARK
jgi:hypothetical protein